MRKYKSKYEKPYIRRLKAGDLKRIMNVKEFGGMWAKISKEVIETARSQNKQVYILTITGTGKILAVNTKKQFLKSLFGSGQVTYKEFNKQCNEYKNVAHNHRESERTLKKKKTEVEQATNAIQQLGNAAVRAAKEITGLKGVQK